MGHFSLALARPKAITAIISQNGNAFVEGLGDFWDHIRPYWNSQTQEKRDSLRWLTNFDTTKSQVCGPWCRAGYPYSERPS